MVKEGHTAAFLRRVTQLHLKYLVEVEGGSRMKPNDSDVSLVVS